MTESNQALLKRLQQMKQLVERACAERDLALTEASLWKKRYETEAQQRQLERSQAWSVESSDAKPDEICEDSGNEVARLKHALAQACEALQYEKLEHQKTRTSLITALGDALQRKTSE